MNGSILDGNVKWLMIATDLLVASVVIVMSMLLVLSIWEWAQRRRMKSPARLQWIRRHRNLISLDYVPPSPDTRPVRLMGAMLGILCVLLLQTPWQTLDPGRLEWVRAAGDANPAAARSSSLAGQTLRGVKPAPRPKARR